MCMFCLWITATDTFCPGILCNTFTLSLHLLVFRKKDLYLVITQKLIFLKSTQNLIKSDVSTKTLQFGGLQGGGYDPGFNVKSAGFHEIERPLARNCNPMFFIGVCRTPMWFITLFSKIQNLRKLNPEVNRKLSSEESRSEFAKWLPYMANISKWKKVRQSFSSKT